MSDLAEISNYVVVLQDSNGDRAADVALPWGNPLGPGSIDRGRLTWLSRPLQ